MGLRLAVGAWARVRVLDLDPVGQGVDLYLDPVGEGEGRGAAKRVSGHVEILEGSESWLVG